jgi:hypothetical protein
MSKLGHFLEFQSPFDYDYRFSIQSLRFSLALNSYEFPHVKRCAELSTRAEIAELVHAACNHDIEWMSRPSNNSVLEDLSRNLELCNLGILPERVSDLRVSADFDLLTMKQGWGFLSENARTELAAVASRRLRSGGLLAVSYPALPAQTGVLALHRLAMTHLGLTKPLRGEALEDVGRVRAAVGCALQFLDQNPAVNSLAWGERSNIEEGLGKLPDEPGQVSFADWSPRHFSDLNATMTSAGLEWLCRAAPIQSVDALDLSPRNREHLETLDDRISQEELRTFLTHPRVRADLWTKPGVVKGCRQELMGRLKFVLVRPAEEFSYTATGALGTIALSRAAYGSLLEKLSGQSGATLDALSAELSTPMERDEVIDCLAVLHGTGFIQVVNPNEDEISRSMKTSRALNQKLAATACTDSRMGVLGSPLTGSGVAMPWLHQVFLAALYSGEREPSGWARFARSVREKTRSPGQTRGAVQDEAERFRRLHLPIYRRLLIVD